MRQNASVETPRRYSGIWVSVQKWPRPTSTLANMRSGRSLQRQSEEFIHRKEWSGGAPWLTLEAPRSAIVGSIHGGFGPLNAVDRPNNHCGKENRERRIRRRSGHGPVERDWDLSRRSAPQAMVTSPRRRGSKLTCEDLTTTEPPRTKESFSSKSCSAAVTMSR